MVSKMRSSVSLVLLALLLIPLLTGCSQEVAATAESTPLPVVAYDPRKVMAEGVIEPAQWRALSFQITGEVVEVLVQEGDTVEAGAVLARLDTAEMERAAARAELALEQARLRLAQLQEPVAAADVEQAENAISQAALTMNVAQANVNNILTSPLFNEALEDARKHYQEQLQRYEDRLRQYQSGESPDYWFVEQAKKSMDEAKLELDRIERAGNLQLQTARADVLRAQLHRQDAEAQLAQIEERPNEKNIALAELDVRVAELALEEARDQLKRAILRAPFDGVVTKVQLEPGEALLPGQVVLTLATLERLQVRTVDLTELRVAKVQVGDPVAVAVNALPEQEFSGVVSDIALQSQDYRGDVVYQVTIDLVTAATGLRWGMTALVEITTE